MVILIPFHREKIQNLVDSYENLLTSQLDDQKLYFEKILAKVAMKSFENRNEFTCDDFDPGKDTLNKFVVISREEMDEWEKSYLDLLQKVCETEKSLLNDRRQIDLSTTLLYKYMIHDEEEMDLKQQREDIHFYLKARMKLNFSPLKEELIGADLFLKKKRGKLNQDKN